MKILAVLFSLLLTYPLYCFDTLTTKANLQGIRTHELGTTIYQYVDLPIRIGRYVLAIQNFPRKVSEQNLRFDTNGVKILAIQWLQESQDRIKRSYPELIAQMRDLRNRLKELDEYESEQISVKKELIDKMVDAHDINSIKDIFRKKDLELKRERLGIYHQLEMIQGEISTLHNFRSNKGENSELTLFLSIEKIDPETKQLSFNYLIESRGTKHLDPALQKDSQIVKAKIVEFNSRLPLIYALVEIYDEKELIESHFTNEEGIFETKLATNKEYSFVINQEGYRNKKVRKFKARPSLANHHRTYSLKEKDPLSFMEFATYALQVASILSVNW